MFEHVNMSVSNVAQPASLGVTPAGNLGAAAPRWHQIAAALEAEIVAGTLERDERLPGEHALAARFAANRGTVRRALAELAARGALRVERGRGSFVAAPPVDYALGTRTTFRENLLRQSILPMARIIRAVRLRAPAGTAARLTLPRGAEIVLLETLSEVDGRPLSYTRHHLPATRVPGLEHLAGALDCISTIYARFGIGPVTRRGSVIVARPPTEEEAHRLRLAANQPILQLETLKVDTTGAPVDLTLARFAGPRVQLSVGEEDWLG